MLKSTSTSSRQWARIMTLVTRHTRTLLVSLIGPSGTLFSRVSDRSLSLSKDADVHRQARIGQRRSIGAGRAGASADLPNATPSRVRSNEGTNGRWLCRNRREQSTSSQVPWLQVSSLPPLALLKRSGLWCQAIAITVGGVPKYSRLAA